jgi:hypothetical protein
MRDARNAIQDAGVSSTEQHIPVQPARVKSGVSDCSRVHPTEVCPVRVAPLGDLAVAVVDRSGEVGCLVSDS